MDTEAIKRFWQKVNKKGAIQDHMPDRCWEWTGSANKDGYGRFFANGGEWRAHRFSYLLATGDEPEQVLHKCHNPKCVRPSHLQGGDSRDNLIDILINRIHYNRDAA